MKSVGPHEKVRALMEMERLIEGWRNSNFENPPYLFSEDIPLFEQFLKGRSKQYSSLREYVSSDVFGDPQDKNLHLGLLPLPYIGDIRNASIFVLMLNPGIHVGDYLVGEPQYFYFRRLMIRNIRQENLDTEYPFLFLNPEHSWHPGFEYFHARFDDLAREIKEVIGSYPKALSQLAQNIACLELVPYPSKSFGAHSLISKLSSVNRVLKFARDELVARAEKEEILVIVTRSVKYWDLPEQKNIILYKGSETRSGHLTKASRKKIMERLGL